MPPEAPEPMMRTSYSGFMLFHRIPVGAEAGSAAAGGGLRFGELARVDGGLDEIVLGGAEEARERVGGRGVGPGLLQRSEQRIGLVAVERFEGLVVARAGIGLQTVEAGAVERLAVGRRLGDEEVEELGVMRLGGAGARGSDGDEQVA